MADLQDHCMATLIAINSKILDERERSWNTYETELLGLVRMVQKHGSYITTSTAQFPTSGLDFKAKIVRLNHCNWSMEGTDNFDWQHRTSIRKIEAILLMV